MFGYKGKILHIDLTNSKSSVEDITEDFCKKYIGGNGLSIYLLYHNSPPHVDPFSPENPLIFAVGPFAGTIVPDSGKYIVQAKSPQTFLMGEAVSSGIWGPMLKWAGFDAVVIKGKSPKPTYLFIDDASIQFKEAKYLWGKTTWETEDIIAKDIGDRSVCVASIGPAGENLVRFGNITNEKNRQAGRTGMGAVMGSKNLKALAVRGTKPLEVADMTGLLKYSHELNTECQGKGTETYRLYGTPAFLEMADVLGTSPTRNAQQSSDPELAKGLGGKYIKDTYEPKTMACHACPIACDHISSLKYQYKGATVSIERESLYALGLMTGIGNFESVARANEFCDRYGMDTISAGLTVSWAMECYQKGILTKKDTDGLELNFGDEGALMEVLRKIVYREGLGNLLAEGSRMASQKLGKGSERFTYQGNGLEIPHFDLRGMKCSALGFMTSTRGAHHMTSSPYVYELSGKVDGTKADPSYGKLVVDQEDKWAVIESLILCKFARNVFFEYEKLVKLYTLVTGIPITVEEMQKAGERIYTLEKAFNVREGETRKNLYPSHRILHEPIANGKLKGVRLTKEEFDMELDAYFKAREWTSEGVPQRQKLVSLGLGDVARDLWRNAQ